jgi:glycosyltransferase involved in cell wall biosynthesis
LDRNEVAKLLSTSTAGLVLFLPEPNHIESQPNKMFEYMSASIPVIASNFSLWRSIIEKNNCGICVDPMDSHEIAEAIDFLTWNPEDAKQMGKNGQAAIKRIYNWGIEEKKLLRLYENLIAKK